MRVAIDVTPHAGPRSGIGHFTAELLRALPAAAPDIEPVPFAVSARAARSRAARSALPAGTHFVPLPAGFAHRLWARSSRPGLDARLGHPDAVHATNFVAPPGRAPRVLSVHDLTFVHRPDLCRPEVRAMAPVVRRAVERGAWVHTLTETVAQAVREWLGIDRVVAVHLAAAPLPAGGAETDAVAAVVSGPPYALAIGTAEPRKNLVAAARALKGVRLVVAGGPGPDTPALDALAAHNPALVLTGYVSDRDRAALLRHARVLVHPAVDEGFGIPVVEAMTEGVPVICSDTAVLREVAGDAAVYIADWSSDRDATRVVTELFSGADRERLVAAGRARATRYSWEQTALGMAALYAQAVEQQ